MIDLGLNGKRAVVSGAGFNPTRAGHGRASALNLGDAGATVVCIDIDEGRGKGIVNEIEAAGGRAFSVIADMTDRSQVVRAIDEAVQLMGGIDVCVDIIGKARFARFEEMSDEDWHADLRDNLTQVFYLYQAAGKQMIRQGTGGSLVAISSVDGIGAAAFHGAYGVAKAGVISLVKTFADELGQYGIRVNAVAPGNVGGNNWDDPDEAFGSNPMNPLSPPRAQDVGDAVLFLSSALADRITGQTLIVDGGVRVRSPWGYTAEMLPKLTSGWYADK
jgi:NAD(P)-dependent dehydrogenase (short-subunit alcohol dehydrogenase family)